MLVTPVGPSVASKLVNMHDISKANMLETEDQSGLSVYFKLHEQQHEMIEDEMMVVVAVVVDTIVDTSTSSWAARSKSASRP